jgi:hypothetical protein
MNLLLGAPEDDRECRGFDEISETGQLPQRVLCVSRQLCQLCDHQIHDVVGVTFCVNAIQIPAPAHRLMIKADEAFRGKYVEELIYEEWIAGRFIVDQTRERRRMQQIAA